MNWVVTGRQWTTRDPQIIPPPVCQTVMSSDRSRIPYVNPLSRFEQPDSLQLIDGR